MDQSRKPCFALTVIITRFYTILPMRGNRCSQLEENHDGHSWWRKNSVPIYIMRVLGNHLNSAQESNLIWNSVAIWLQDCKRPAERSLNRAVDGGFVGDLGSLCAVNLLKEDPVYANRANLLNLVTQAENMILFCTWLGRPEPLHVESVPENRASTILEELRSQHD